MRVREDGCTGCVARSGRVGGRELGAGTRARGERAHGRWARRRSQTGAGVHGRARHGRAAGRHAGSGRRAGHGRPGRGLGAACVHGLGQLGQVGVLCTMTRFFGPVRLGIFPESLNEHCSL